MSNNAVRFLELRTIGNPHDPHGLHRAMQRYLHHWRARTQGVGGRSMQGMKSRLCRFIAWCDAHDIKRPGDITLAVLERYQHSLASECKDNGEGLAIRSQVILLGAVRGWLRWLAACGEIPSNPATAMRLPSPPKSASHARLYTPQEIELILRQPNRYTPDGIRDRAALELLYGSGLKRLELVNLRVDDLDVENKTVFIRAGRGKNRRLAVSARALECNAVYLRDVRPALIWNDDPGFFYLNRDGHGFNGQWITNMIARHIARAGLRK